MSRRRLEGGWGLDKAPPAHSTIGAQFRAKQRGRQCQFPRWNSLPPAVNTGTNSGVETTENQPVFLRAVMRYSCQHMTDTPLWTVCIATTHTRPDYRSVRNSLLYADRTDWISLEVVHEMYSALHRAFGIVLDSKSSANVTVDLKEPQACHVFAEELRQGGAGNLLRRHFDGDQALSHFTRLATDFASGKSKMPNVRDSIRAEVEDVLRRCSVLVGESWLTADQTQHWNARNAAHGLMMALSRILLPDVSALPVDAIMDLRARLNDSLDPVRAEMLRLTADLRQLVGNTTDAGLIAAEADNLIATRVEPVVRDASRRAAELQDAKWRKLLGGAAKAFGFAGACFVDPKLIAKAVQQTLETGALAFGNTDDTGPPALVSTSQFVLRARQMAAGIDN